MSFSYFRNHDIEDIDTKRVYYNCSTRPISEEINIRWQINHIDDLIDDNGFEVRSPKFPSTIEPQVEWFLSLYPNGVNEGAEGFCSLYLAYSGSKEVYVDYIVFELMNENNEPGISIKMDSNKFKNGCDWGFGKFIEHSQLNEKGFFQDDALIIICKFEMHLNKSEMKDKTFLNEQCKEFIGESETEMKPIITASDNPNTAKMFGKDKFSDTELVVKDETFKVHKVILSCASPVFMEMFENTNSAIHIQDTSSNIIKEMLRYIYTGELQNLTDIAHELVVVAHKYNIQGLKEECEKSLSNYLTKDNLLDMLLLAESYDLRQLHASVTNLFILHRNEIVCTPEFKEMSISNRIIISNFLISLITDKRIQMYI